MTTIDWLVLSLTLFIITAYGLYISSRVKSSEVYISGSRDMKWWAICISIMTTQASAVTFISTPGQGFEDGMRFVQFYFGLPLAMIFLSAFVLPVYYSLRVKTAYEYLEGRFDLKTRSLTTILFLIQRALGAGLTIYAPAIVLSIVLEWNLKWTIFALSILTILYTSLGGYKAVAKTQQQQVIVILAGMVAAFFVILHLLPPDIGLKESFQIAGQTGRMNLVDFKFDPTDRYNFWSGVLGGFFLFVSYFGTDQSQVGRYLSGASLKESRMGLLLNGILKVPMQFFILLLGVLVFVFYIFNQPPLHFNPGNVSAIEKSTQAAQWKTLEVEYNQLIKQREEIYRNGIHQSFPDNKQILVIEKQLSDKRVEAREMIVSAVPEADVNDKDYVFISFILKYLPHGLIGLLIAVIFSSSMSSKASELNALSSATMVDIIQRNFYINKPDRDNLRMNKLITVFWGLMAMAFAMICTLFENLIQAVNIIGSLFYGAVLGVFAVAFFFKRIGGTAVFWAAIISELIILTLYLLDIYDIYKIAFLWYNLIGCVLVILLAAIFQSFISNKTIKEI